MISDGHYELFDSQLRRRSDADAMPSFNAPGVELQRIGRQAHRTRPDLYERRFKRALDLVLVLCAALPVTLIVAILALAVAVSGHRPFYAQTRLGKGGKPFRMWKIRTMVPEADAILRSHLSADPAARAEWDRNQKLRHDPRIIPLGHVLRRTSLDELPQLFNVLRGEMALVGPRPMLREQSAYYPGTEYYEMRPGVTGFWQTSERNESSFAQRADYDRSYYHALSAGIDLKVLLRTVVVVARGTGL